MNKEELLKLSEKLSKLNDLEKRKRDIYLRKIAIGEISGPTTGYPGLDKPWLKYYKEDDIKDLIPQQTIYDYLIEHTANKFDNLTAISYYGNEINYSHLYENIDIATKVLSSVGVNNNDRIMYLMPNIPETAYLFYATSRIGAVADYIDPRPDSINPEISSKKVLSLIEKEKIKHIIALDQCYLAMIKPIEHELKNLGIDKVITVSANDSMNLKSIINYSNHGKIIEGKEKFNNKIKRNNQINKLYKEAKKNSTIKVLEYKDLIKNVKYQPLKDIEYEPDKMIAITHTSGTTGQPKPVPLTHDNLNTYAHESFRVRAPFNPGYKVMHILPYFASYGIANVVHPGLTHGTNLLQIPEVETQNFGKILHLNKPEISVGIPSWYIAMMNDPYMRDKDLSNLKFMSFGGIGMSADDEEKINNFLHEHGAKINLSKGHGMSETSGCSSLATENVNELRSLGIPLPYTSYSIIDPITKEPLCFKENQDELEGEMIISTKAATSGILDDEKYITHKNYFGDDYILTGDIARIRKDGVMNFDSRLDRGFPRCDGFNIKPGIIEETIESDSLVKYCIISPYYDETRLGNMVKATIVLNTPTTNEEEMIEIVQKIINEKFINNHKLSARQIPTKYVFTKEIPKTPSDKIDYNKIDECETNENTINVEIDESNISINSIKVKGNTKKRILSK